jgi:citrate synthase
MSTVTVPRGLAGVVVTDTELGDVRGSEGFYHYRQYSAVDLAETCSLEEVWHLLLEGHLPDPGELAAYREGTGAARVAPAALAEVLPVLVRDAGSPLTALRTAWSWLGGHLHLPPVYDATPAERAEHGLRLAALAPTVLAAAHRLAAGLEPLPADPGLGHTEDYLRMVTGRLPSPEDVRALEQYLVLTVDHGFNASTFTARTVASSGADPAAALVAAIGTFSGPLHGGAPSRALEALDEIGTPDRARAWVREQIAAGRRVMGFGHAVYRTRDPRSETLKAIALDRGGALAELAVQVEQEVEQALAELKPDRHLYANVEFYAGVVMDQVGLPRPMFTPTFCVARAIGWVANVLEQAADPKIIRPAARYVGPPAPQPVPAQVPKRRSRSA